MKGADYSAGHPTPAQLKAAGIGFVCRYLSTPGNPKNLTRTEATGLRAAGILIVTVFETIAKRALFGHGAGKADAVSALAQGMTCGMPKGSPIYFAVDFDATPQQQAAINAYLRGAGEVLGPELVGVYGGYYVVGRALDAKAAHYAWQTVAWSGGQWQRRAHIRQIGGGHIGGIAVDFDYSYAEDFGQWHTKPRPPDHEGKPQPPPFVPPPPTSPAKPAKGKPFLVTTTGKHGEHGGFYSATPGLLRVVGQLARGRFAKVEIQRVGRG